MVAQMLEPSDEVALHGLALVLSEIVACQHVVRDSTGEHVVDDHQDRVPEHYERFLGAASGRKTVIVRRQVGVLGTRRRALRQTTRLHGHLVACLSGLIAHGAGIFGKTPSILVNPKCEMGVRGRLY